MQNIKEQQLIDDIENIYLGNLGTIDTDLILPTRGDNGSVFEWKSGENLFLSDNGKVNRPSPGVGNRVVPLYLSAKLEENTINKTYEVTILEEIEKVEIEAPIDITLTIYSEDYTLPNLTIVKLTDGSYTTAEVLWEGQFDPSKKNQTIKGHLKENGEEVKANLSLSDSIDSEHLDNMSDISTTILGEGVYSRGYHSMLQHLKEVNENQLLFNFRAAAKLPVNNDYKMTGWDSPDCNLKGHTTGHYMSALALGYFNSKDNQLKEKLDDMVNELKICQEELEKNGASVGFLSAYDEEQFDLLEKYETYPNIWAPYYTLDKIMGGLLDSYYYTHNDLALSIVEKMGSWVVNRLSNLTQEQLNKMWSIYIAGEFGGMMSVMIRLYEYTDNTDFLKTAYLFINDKLFLPMLKNYDTLKNMHANQHIPQIIGSVDLYRETKDINYLKIAEHFWDIVVNNHSYSNGGVSETEMFHGANTTFKYLTDKTIESCASHNMFKLSKKLFDITFDNKYIEYCENVLNNHLLVANNHTPGGGTTYFLPLEPGGIKKYDTGLDNTCCHGTGLESMVRFQKDIFFLGDKELFVNLFYDSHATLPDGYGEISQECSNSRIKINSSFNKELNLFIRLPHWMKNLKLTINNQAVEYSLKNGYIYLPQLKDEKTITLEFEKKLLVIPTSENPNLISIFYGPDMLVKQSNRKDWIILEKNNINTENIKEQGSKIKINDYTFTKFNHVFDEHYHAYFKI